MNVMNLTGRLACAARWAGARPRRDERGEAIPAAILFVGVMITILLGVHVVIVAMARTSVQSAADAGLLAAQSAGANAVDCDGATMPARECEGVLAARLALVAARGSVVETRLPAVVPELDRGSVTMLVFGGVNSPLLGGIELTAQACGPLDDVPAQQLVGSDVWEC